MRSKSLFSILALAGISVGILAYQTAASTDDWAIKAEIAESCSCDPTCPCMFGSPPTRDPCEGSRLYDIEKGHFGDVSVDGLQVVATFRMGKWVKYYVSDRATDEQLKAVASLISRASPALDVEVLTLEKVAISVERTDSRVKFTAPASTVEIEAIEGLDGTPIKIHNLPDSDLVDYAQYKSVENSHKSPKDSFHYSGTNGFTSRLDARG